MIKYSKSHLIRQLTKEGLNFSEFELINIGDYEVDDADWNYKDVPHLHIVHDLAEAIPAVVGDEIINTINMQKVMGLRFPFALVNYQSAENAQTYYTTWLFYVLIIETKYESIGDCRTKVTTTYAIGCPKILKFTFPILRWILKRNYKDLMSTDIPMRNRRGELRKWGYEFFKEDDAYSFAKTMNISKNNVKNIEINNEDPLYSVNINDAIPNDGELFLGRDDHVGIRLVRKNNSLMFFPRMCPHEGASLDSYSCSGGKDALRGDALKCPWHGRAFKSFATIDLNSSGMNKIDANGFSIQYNDNNLIINILK